LVGLVETVASRLGLNAMEYSLALSGGVFSNHPSMVASVLDHLSQIKRTPRTVQLVNNPVYGPLMMAANHSVV